MTSPSWPPLKEKVNLEQSYIMVRYLMNPTEPNNQKPKPAESPFGRPASQSTEGPLSLPSDVYPTASADHSQLYSPPGGPVNTDSKSASHQPPKIQGDGWRSVLSTIFIFLLAPVIALLTAAFVIQSYQVDGQSMESALQNHDRLIVDKLPRTWARVTGHAYIPKRGDIIIFNQANLPGDVGQEKQLIKRVIGLPGERVVVKDGNITVFNSSHPQGFNPDSSSGYHITAALTPGTSNVSLKSDQIFVCGDNRGNSEDSRYFGPVTANNIVGKLSLRLLPISKIERF